MPVCFTAGIWRQGDWKETNLQVEAMVSEGHAGVFVRLTKVTEVGSTAPLILTDDEELYLISIAISEASHVRLNAASP